MQKFKNQRVGFAIWIVWWGLAFPLIAWPANEAFLLESMLPETTLAAGIWPQIDSTLQQVNQSVLADTVAAWPAVETSLQQLTTLLHNGFEALNIPGSSDLLLSSVSVALALIDLAPSAETGPSERLTPEFLMIVERTEAADRKTDEGEQALTLIRDDQQIMIAAKPIRLSYAVTGSFLILAQRPGTLRGALQKLQQLQTRPDKALPALGNAASYQRMRTFALNHSHDVRIYVNMQAGAQKLRPFFERQETLQTADWLRELFRLADDYALQTVNWMVTFRDGIGYERMFWECGPQSEVFQMPTQDVSQAPLSLDRLIPSQVLLCVMTRIDATRLWRSLTDSVETLSQSWYHTHFQHVVSQLEALLQLNISDEIIPAIGHEFAIACYDDPRHRARSLPGLEGFPFFLCLRILDREIFSHILERVVAHLQPDSRPIRFRGTSVYAARLPGRVMPIPVYASLIRDILVLTVSRSLLQEVITVSQQGGALASNAEYLRISSRLSADAQLKGYVNLRKFLRRLPLEQRPATIASLSGLMWGSTVQEEGILTESSSPLGGIVLSAFLAWLLL